MAPVSYGVLSLLAICVLRCDPVGACDDLLSAGLLNTYVVSTADATSRSEYSSLCSLDTGTTFSQYEQSYFSHEESRVHKEWEAGACAFGICLGAGQKEDEFHLTEMQFNSFSQSLQSWQKSQCAAQRLLQSREQQLQSAQAIVPPELFSTYVRCLEMNAAGMKFKQSSDEGMLFVDLNFAASTGHTVAPRLVGLTCNPPDALQCFLSGDGAQRPVPLDTVLNIAMAPNQVFSLFCLQLLTRCNRSAELSIMTSVGSTYRAFVSSDRVHPARVVAGAPPPPAADDAADATVQPFKATFSLALNTSALAPDAFDATVLQTLFAAVLQELPGNVVIQSIQLVDLDAGSIQLTLQVSNQSSSNEALQTYDRLVSNKTAIYDQWHAQGLGMLTDMTLLGAVAIDELRFPPPMPPKPADITPMPPATPLGVRQTDIKNRGSGASTPLVAGVVGGVAALVIVSAMLAYWLRRHRMQAVRQPGATMIVSDNPAFSMEDKAESGQPNPSVFSVEAQTVPTASSQHC